MEAPHTGGSKKRAAGSALHSIFVFLAEANHDNCELMEQALRRQRGKFSVAASAGSSVEVLQNLQEKEPDVAVVSTNLSDGPLMGFKVLRELHVLHPKTRVVMLVDVPTRELVTDGFRCGAHGIFRRDAPFAALCKCICAVHAGQIWANSEELHYILEALAGAIPLRVVDAKGALLLSRREEAIAQLVAEGLKNQEIATNLNLSEHTVRNYLFRVFNKLGVSSRVELALYMLSTQQNVQKEKSKAAQA